MTTNTAPPSANAWRARTPPSRRAHASASAAVPAVARSPRTPARAPGPPSHSRYAAATSAAMSPAQPPSTRVTSAIGTARASTKILGLTSILEIISATAKSPKTRPFSSERRQWSIRPADASQRRAYE